MTSTLAPVPVPTRGSGPVQCSEPTCRSHRAKCLFGRQHTWQTWYENGQLMRTTDTFHCIDCGGVCTGEEEDGELTAQERAENVAAALRTVMRTWNNDTSEATAPTFRTS